MTSHADDQTEGEAVTLREELAALRDSHRDWKSECWNPVNPHVRTCQNGQKPCEMCAAIIQSHVDFANELDPLIARLPPAPLTAAECSAVEAIQGVGVGLPPSCGVSRGTE